MSEGTERGWLGQPWGRLLRVGVSIVDMLVNLLGLLSTSFGPMEALGIGISGVELEQYFN